MKICNLCGDSYSDHVDFCFNEGSILVAQKSAMDVPEPGGLDAPVRQPGDAQSTRTPTPRNRRRSLIGGRHPASASALVSPTDVPDPLSAPTLTPVPTSEETPAPGSPTLVPEDAQRVEAPVPSPEEPEYAAPAAAAAPPVPQIEQAVTPPAASTSPTPAPPPPVETLPAFDDAREQPQSGPNRMVLVAGVGVVALLLLIVLAILGGTGVLFAASNSGTIEVTPAPKKVPPTPQSPAPVEAPDEATPAATTADPSEDGSLPVEDEEPEPGGTPEPAPAEPAPAQPAPVAPAPVEDPDDAVAEVAPEPEPALGTLLLRSDPSGATVTIDGNPAGKTPTKANLAYGSHEVVLTLDGHQSKTQTVDVASASVTLPVFTLATSAATSAPAPAAGPTGPVMVFFSGRVGDTLSIDGRSAGNLPAKVDIAGGEHTFTVSGASGEVTVKRKVTLKADGSTTIVHLDH